MRTTRRPSRRLLALLALQALGVGLLAGIPAGGAVAAGVQGAATPAAAVRLLAHDVSHAIRARPHGHPHATPRRTALVARFESPLTRLLKPRRSLSSLLAPVTIGSWDGTAGPGGYAPADPNGDIGMTQYVQAINFRLAVYSRAAPHTILALATSSQFWNGLSGPDAAGLCATSPGGDPVIQYDRLADRWVYSEFAFAVDGAGNPVAPFVQCVAVSTGADATGTWNRYAFQVSNTTTNFPDYPKLGVWPDGYYLSYNQFNLVTGSFVGAGALALERSAMLTGAAAQARYFDLRAVNPGLGGMLPATMDATNLPPAGAPELYLQSQDDPTNANDRLEVWAFHVDWTAPGAGSTFQPIANLPVNTFDSTFSCGSANCIVQPGTLVTLDQLATVVQSGGTIVPQLMYHLDYMRDLGGTQRLVATQAVNVGGNEAGVRWYQLSNSGAGWSVLQQGTYAPDADSRFMSSGGIDNSGELALAYSVSGAATFPSLRYTGRLPADGAGVMSIAETSLFAGAASQTDTGHWGDYSSLSLDPLDLCTFWYTGEYASLTGWRTRIGEFDFSTCIPKSPTRPVLTVDPIWSTPIVREGQTISGTAATFTGATSVAYQWRRCDRYGFSCVDIPGEIALTHVFSAADAAGDRTVRLQETATNATGVSVSASTATPVVQSLPPVNMTRPTISGTAQAAQVLATTNGTWTSSSPLSYTYRWRRCASSCVFIAGATAASYTVTAADVASTLDVVVSATNTGGGTDANADPTTAVTPAPVVGGGSGGSGGGGGSGSGGPDLQVTGFASLSAPLVGDDVTFVLTVTDKNAQPADKLYVNVTLSSGVQYVTSTTDRGSGCVVTSFTTLKCFLDWLSGDALSGHLQITAKVIAAGLQTLTATATDQQGDIDASNNTVAFTLNAPSNKSTSAVPAGLNGDGTTKALPDKKKPTSHAFTSTGRRGQAAALRFRIYDDRGVAKAVATVKRNGKSFGTATSGFGPVAYGSTYFVGWRVPATAPAGSYAFCVVATDRAGNHSPSSCASLTLK